MEMNGEPTPGTPAPYGRACSNCARAKTKCVTGTGDGGKCRRCLRLNKHCQPLQTVRKRKTVDRPSAARTERLEEKLDGLYKLLQSSTPSTSIAGQAASVAPTLTQSASESLQSLVTSPENGGDFGRRSIHRLNSDRPTIDGLSLHPPTVGPDGSYVVSGTRSKIYHYPENALSNGLEPSPEEAEEYLNIFRPHMAAYFPFILVPETRTALELRRDRPFLWLCIMSIASKSSVQQNALGREMRITMGREILAEGKNSIDLLLGLLVFVAWGHYHIHDKPIISQATQLAMALLGNLGLNKPPLKESTQMVLNLDARGCPIKPFSPSTRTTEERRAVLGCFLLSSVVSSYFQRLDALRWTPYLDECLAVLAENKEHPTDLLLVHLVKLQLLAEKVSQAPWHEGHGDAIGPTRAPPIFYLKALQAQLQDFKANISPEIRRNEILLLHLYSMELKVHEVVFVRPPVVFNSPGFQRLESLYACLQATKSWFDIFLSFPPASYVGFSIPVFTQMAHCIIALFRLSTFDDPVWDRGLVRETADLSLILGRIIEKHNQVKVAADLNHGASEGKDVFSGTARTIVSIKTWWDAKLAAELTDNIVLNETLDGMNMDFSDDLWLKDILGQGDGIFDLNMQWLSAENGV